MIMKRRKTIVILISLLVLSQVFLAGGGGKKPDEGNNDLVAYWNFQEADLTSPVVQNILRNGLNGEIYGAIRDEGVMVFDGNDDYVAIRGINKLASLGKGSISVWFKFASDPIGTLGGPPNCHPIFYAGDGKNPGLIIEVGHSPISQNTKLYFTINTTGGDAFAKPVFCFDSNVNLQKDQWYHFVAVVGDDFNTGYLNGQELIDRHYNFAVGGGDKQELGPTNSIFLNDLAEVTECWIGRGVFLGSQQYFDGEIDDVRIYEEALGKEQVLKLYNEK